jgi:hypothetical protein
LAAAAAAAGGATGVGVGILQPSTSGVSFGAPSGSFDLVPRPGSYAEAPTPAATGPAASDFTAGTDSGVQGRLPPAGVTASDYTGTFDRLGLHWYIALSLAHDWCSSGQEQQLSSACRLGTACCCCFTGHLRLVLCVGRSM